MTKNPYICTRILTDYRAVAHILEGVIILCMFILQFFIDIQDWVRTLCFIAGAFEILKGVLLLNGIIKDNKTTVDIYLALSFMGLMIRKGLTIYKIATTASQIGLTASVIIIFIAIFYFTYEWFMFYHVRRFYKNMMKFRGNSQSEKV